MECLIDIFFGLSVADVRAWPSATATGGRLLVGQAHWLPCEPRMLTFADCSKAKDNRQQSHPLAWLKSMSFPSATFDASLLKNDDAAGLSPPE